MAVIKPQDDPPFAALALISAGALSYEILLTRLFSIIQWHHFAYMTISLAMLGYGVSGTLLTLFRERLLPRYGVWFAASAAAFGVCAVGAFLLAQQLPIFTNARWKAASHVPPPLIKQLKRGGRMLIPLGSSFLPQHLVLVEKDANDRVRTRELLPVKFVPLTGAH